MQPQKNKINKSFFYAFKGLGAAYNERNFKVHLAGAFLATIAGFIFKISETEWLVVIAFIAMVMTAEIFNTAIEGIVDIISPQWQQAAGRIKDLAASAVLVTAIASVIAAGIIFIPKMVACL